MNNVSVEKINEIVNQIKTYINELRNNISNLNNDINNISHEANTIESKYNDSKVLGSEHIESIDNPLIAAMGFKQKMYQRFNITGASDINSAATKIQSELNEIDMSLSKLSSNTSDVSMSMEIIALYIRAVEKKLDDKNNSFSTKLKLALTNMRKDSENNYERLKRSMYYNKMLLRYSNRNFKSTNIEFPAAEAGLLMALPSKKDAQGSYGSDLYIRIFDRVFRKHSERQNDKLYRTGEKKESPDGSSRYRSCSEAVSTAIRWSKTDKNYPSGGPASQLNYLNTSEEWENVPWNGDITKLQPGDVFVDENHTFIYVGNDLIKQYFPDAPSDYNIIEASYNSDYINKARSLSIANREDLLSGRWTNNVYRHKNEN